MSQAPAPLIERYDTSTFGPGRSDVALRSLPLGEPERLGPLFAAMDPWAELGIGAEALAIYLARIEKSAPRYGLMSGHAIAGAACVRLNWLYGPYLQFLGITATHQGQQLGSTFLNWLASEARTAGERNVWVCASGFNSRALKFYQRHGFLPVGQLDGLVKEGVPEYLLRLKL